MLTVKDRMATDIMKVDAAKSALDVAKLMGEKKIGSLLVATNGKISGIITETDLVRKVMAAGANPSAMKCSEVMSSPLKSVSGSMKLYEAAEFMDSHHIRHLTVEENGEIVGLISVRDLIHPEFKDGEGW